MASSADIRPPGTYRYQASPSTALRMLHRGCVAGGIYLVALLLLLDITLVLVRRHFGHMQAYYFIRWNLLLALVPYGAGLCAAVLYRAAPPYGWRQALRRWLLLPLYALWLLFLPNAPYLLTDFVHLEDKTLLQVWYDTTMLATYAVTGYALAILSLALVHRPVRAILGWQGGWLFVGIACFLAGVGVHLGRAERYNSTDVFSRSGTVLRDVLNRLAHLYEHPHTVFDGLSYGALLLGGYVAVLALGRKEVRTLLLRGQES